MKEFKIRSSGAGQIMGGKLRIEATEVQLKNILAMEARVKPMTEKQKIKYNEDIIIRDNPRDNPELPAGAKSFCQKWMREQPELYNRRKEFSSKQTDKGNFCESLSIDFLNQQLRGGWVKREDEDWVKCEESKENDFITGTADIVADDMIIDIKNSWDSETFPLFDFGIKNKDYFYQLQCYMELYDKPRAALAYTLMDAPLHLITREAKSQAFHANVAFDDIFSQVHAHMTYGNVDPKFRKKIFYIDRDPSVIVDIEKRVKLCRSYIETLIEGVEK